MKSDLNYSSAVQKVEPVLTIERQRIIAELKTLTRSETAKELNAAIAVWKKQIDSDALGKAMLAANRERAVLAVCKKLRITYGASFVKLFASLNRFRRLHGDYEYLNAMQSAHERNRALLVDGLRAADEKNRALLTGKPASGASE